MEKLPHNLKKARKRAKLTQNQLEVKGGLSRGTVSHIEIGNRMPSLKTIKILADNLGISIDSLCF